MRGETILTLKGLSHLKNFSDSLSAVGNFEVKSPYLPEVYWRVTSPETQKSSFFYEPKVTQDERHRKFSLNVVMT